MYIEKINKQAKEQYLDKYFEQLNKRLNQDDKLTLSNVYNIHNVFSQLNTETIDESLSKKDIFVRFYDNQINFKDEVEQYHNIYIFKFTDTDLLIKKITNKLIPINEAQKFIIESINELTNKEQEQTISPLYIKSFIMPNLSIERKVLYSQHFLKMQNEKGKNLLNKLKKEYNDIFEK